MDKKKSKTFYITTKKRERGIYSKEFQLLPSIEWNLLNVHPYEYSLNANIVKYTYPQYTRLQKCKECGLMFISNSPILKKEPLFCSHKCANIFFGRKRTEETLKLSFKILTNEDIKYFYNKYNKFAYSEIYKYQLYHDDLIEIWHTKGINLARFLKKSGRLKPCKDFRLVANFIKWYGCNLHKMRKDEVFYSDLSIKDQIRITGEIENEYY